MTTLLLAIITFNAVLWLLFPKLRVPGCAILGSIIGGFLSSDAANDRRRRLEEIANTPGLDVGAVGQEAIGIGGALLPGASNLVGQINQANTAQRRGVLETSLPGYQGRKESQLATIDSWLGGNVPQDVINQIQRSGAARSFGGGYSGSGLHRNLEARDLGLSSLDMIMRGMDAASGMNRETAALEMPDMVSVQDYAGPSTNELLNIRGSEREQRIAGLVGAANAPTGKEVWTQALQNIEQQIMELAGTAAGAMGCWVAREVYGVRDKRWVFFYNWLFTEGPKWLASLYLKFGERFAAWIANKPRIKSIIRKLMDKAIGE